jgi:putative acetyltransferase
VRRGTRAVMSGGLAVTAVALDRIPTPPVPVESPTRSYLPGVTGSSMVTIEPERPADVPGVRRVVEAAFDTPAEADLVEALRDSDGFVPECALVARDGEDGEDGVVGQVLLTETGLLDAWPAALTLAPVAVHPGRQGEGIGGDLVRAGLENAHREGYDLVFLHGDPDFYGQFGFEPAVPAGVENSLDLPDPDFQVCELTPGALEAAEGRVSYPSAFDGV